VTLEEDMEEIRHWFEALSAEMGIRQPPALGAMIETPAAALNVAAIARSADFLSIGTNDLTQYTLAAGRDDPAVIRYYQDNHVSVLRLLRLILAEAGTRPLTLCGELAAREEMLPHLLEMGFRSLSLSPPSIPPAKELIRALRLPLPPVGAPVAI
ncbi:MAG TPA: putative PEP-binding protein, partial [Bacillota bacterium]|nr:putative PEP-binding protein [Bacillota bacterium]